jgi:hypothetical protein
MARSRAHEALKRKLGENALRRVFSYLTTLKSNSTVAIVDMTVAIPPASLIRKG